MSKHRATAHELDDVDRLVAGILRRAVADAKQRADPALAQEAWLFLDVCAPTVAQKLRHRMNNEMTSETALVASEKSR